MTASEELARFSSGLRFEEIPAPVTEAAKRHLTDALGTGLAGAAAGIAAPVVEAVRSWSGAREATVLGSDLAAPAAWAALANGTLVHGLDFDDTHVESIVHPSAVVLPAVLAVGEEAGASGRDLIAAAVAGYEVATRIGAAAPGRFHARGQHATGICGPFGAAAAAARLWGLDEAQTTAALGIAGSQSSGLFAFAAGGAATKRFHAGWAAAAGVVAADLARRGFTGPATVLEGPSGLYDAFLSGETADLARVTRGLGEEWETTRIAMKPHPACHFLHAFMDAAARLDAGWGDVEDVECAVAAPIVGVVCEPAAAKAAPATPYAAQFSLPFAVAAAIVGGRSGIEMFGEEAIADRRVLTLAERVHYVVDDTLGFPAAYGGRITVHTRGGRAITIDEPVNRGHPDRPLTGDEVAEKFLDNATRRLDAGAAEKALGTMRALEDLDSAEGLAALVRIDV